MTLLTWKPEWETGLPLIDEQHRQLFGQFDALMVAIHENQPGDRIPALLAFLASYVDTHFSLEEKQMELTQYPGFIRHKAIHDDLRAQVVELVEHYPENPSVVTEDVIHFLTDWLIGHIDEHDRRMARHLLSFDRPKPEVAL